MEELCKILCELDNKNAAFCLQVYGKEKFYNVAVVDVHGKRQYFHSPDIKGIIETLKIINNQYPRSMPIPRP